MDVGAQCWGPGDVAGLGKGRHLSDYGELVQGALGVPGVCLWTTLGKAITTGTWSVIQG